MIDGHFKSNGKLAHYVYADDCEVCASVKNGTDLQVEDVDGSVFFIASDKVADCFSDYEKLRAVVLDTRSKKRGSLTGDWVCATLKAIEDALSGPVCV